jgi:hypothetical protein
VLIRAQAAARTPRTREVVAEARVPRDASEVLLEELLAAGWIARVVGDRWTLACDPDQVTIAQVYERLVFAGAGAWDGADTVLDGVMERAAASASRAIGAPLRTLVDEEKAPPRKRSGRQEEPAPRAVGGVVKR